MNSRPLPGGLGLFIESGRAIMKLIRVGLLLFVVTFLTKVTGFLRETLIAGYFGASAESDAYFIAIMIPTILFILFSTPLSTIIVPTFTKLYVEQKVLLAERYFNTLFTLVLIIVALFVTGCIGLCEPILLVLFSGLENIELTVVLTQIYLPSLIPATLILFASNLLQVKKSYLTAMLSLLMGNVIVAISIIILHDVYSIYSAVYGMIISQLYQAVVLCIVLYHANLPVRLSLIFDQSIKALILENVRQVMPIVLSTLVIQCGMLVDRYLASGLASGTITSINFAFKVNEFVTGIIITVFSTLLYQNVSALFHMNKLDELKAVIGKSIRVTLLISIPILLNMILYAEGIIDLLFGYGAFTDEQVASTGRLLFMYAFSIPMLILTGIFVKILYAMGLYRYVMLITVSYVTVNIVLGLLLVHVFKAQGIILAFTLSNMLGTLLYWVKISRYYQIRIRKSSFRFIGVLACAVSMIAMINAIISQFDWGLFTQLIVGAPIGMVVYGILLCVFRVPELTGLYHELKFYGRDAR